MKELPKISRRQTAYSTILRYLCHYDLDEEPPKRSEWAGLRRLLFFRFRKLVWHEGSRLRKKYGNTTYRKRLS